jgi:hypothetical protein
MKLVFVGQDMFQMGVEAVIWAVLKDTSLLWGNALFAQWIWTISNKLLAVSALIATIWILLQMFAKKVHLLLHAQMDCSMTALGKIVLSAHQAVNLACL